MLVGDEHVKKAPQTQRGSPHTHEPSGAWRLHKSDKVRTSVVGQRLRLCLPVQRVQAQILVWELRSHMLHGQQTKA